MDTSMVIAIVFAIIFIGFLLAFGIGQMQNFFCLSDQASTLNAAAELKDKIEGLYSKAEGSGDLYDLRLPSSSKICFFEVGSTESNTNHFNQRLNWIPESYMTAILEDPLSSFADTNVWIFHCNGDTAYKIRHMMPHEGTPGHEGAFCAYSGMELFLKYNGTDVLVSLND